ncbi:MAG: phage terminase large subunit [Candidatus Gracilibacteria bacterium]|nr:phage terminase large subunit [Candidatus Gracilibacteria bacterium]
MEILDLEDLEIIENILENLSESEIKEYIYSKSYYDIEFFGDYFLYHFKKKDGKFIKSPNFHKQIWKNLDSEKNINIIIPRGHGKTTSIIIWMLWALLYEKHKEILYIASSNLGEETIGKIKKELEENEYILEIFGNLSPNNETRIKKNKTKKWRQKQLELTNGCKIQTLSKGQSIRGKRPSKIIIDDPQENSDVEYREATEKFNTWFFTSLYNTLLPGSSVCSVGTIIGNLCLVKHLRDEKKWKTLEYKAIKNNKPLWPGLWNKKALLERKKILGTACFNQEFLNIPLSKENTVIKEQWLKYYNKLSFKDFEQVIMAVDPAIKTSEKNDFTGITIIGEKNNKKYVIFSKNIKLTPRKLEEYIIELNKKHRPTRIIQESNIEVKLLEDLKKKGLPIMGVRANKDKYSRLLEVSNFLEYGEVFFRGEKDEELCYQLTNFPDIKHDDLLDSFVYCLNYFNSENNNKIVLI